MSSEGVARKGNEIDMTNGPIVGKMLQFAIPLMVSSILQLLFNAADVVVVGRFCGDIALAAVGSNGSIINLTTGLFIGMATGSTVLIARLVGAKDKKEVHKAVHTSMAIALLAGALLTVVVIALVPVLAAMINSPSDVRPSQILYLRIYYLGSLGVMAYNFGAGILRAVGDTKKPLIYLTTAGVVNFILNLLFVVVFKMDVAGVGLATVISQFVSGGLVFIELLKYDGDIRLEIKKIRIYKKALLEILRIGVPAGINSIIFNISNVIIMASINSFGSAATAGNSAATTIESFVYQSMNSFFTATMTFTSQNMGAGRYDRITKVLRSGLICAVCAWTVFGVNSVVFGRQLAMIFTQDEEVIQAALMKIKVLGGTYFLCGMMEVTAGSIRGIGYSMIPTINSIFGSCVIRIIWVNTFFRLAAYHTLPGLFLCYPISWIVTLLLHSAVFAYIWKKRYADKAKALLVQGL